MKKSYPSTSQYQIRDRLNRENNRQEEEGAKSKPCKNEKLKKKIDFTFRLHSATTADSRRGESHRLTPSRIATEIVCKEPPRFLEPPTRTTEEENSESNRDSSCRRETPTLTHRCSHIDENHRREPPKQRTPKASVKTEQKSRVGLKFSSPNKITSPITYGHASSNRRFLKRLIKTQVLS